ncbi:MAG TPA: MBL fold metallo-hydrolase [Lysobacter sp.]|nr:MBL fold metallo-hydrolase [Lysobacter sp.]
MRIHHLNCGTLCPFGGRFMDGQPGLLRAAHLVCHCLLIETEAGLVLVDTGLGRKDVEQPYPRLSRTFGALLRPQRRMADTAYAQLRALGYADTDVRHIIITHLDFDHAGGIEDFPHAKVHVYAEELNAATHARGWVAQRRYRPLQWNRAVQWKTYAAHGEPWYGFRCVRELDGLPPEILMVPLVGHTLGHCGVAVRDERGQWLLLAGDAYFDRREIPRQAGAAPRCAPGLRLYQRMMDSDRTARFVNQQRLRELALNVDARVRIMCSHDAVEFAQAAGA